MKRLAFTFPLALLLCLMAAPVGAQLFPQPQPLMYDRGHDPNLPMPGIKRVVMSRYIAGARFPNDWDVIVESYTYNQRGDIVQWNRYNNITGEATLQTSYSWFPDGRLQSEHITLASDHSEVRRDYVWQKDANGAFTKADILDKNKKPIATLEILPDGRYVMTETSLGNGKSIQYTYNARKQMVRSANSSSGLTEDYTYDDAGRLVSVVVGNASGTRTTIQYSNKLDDKGRVVSQTETGRSAAAKTFHFSYDDAGHLVDRYTVKYQPTESRAYDPMGRLANVLFFDAQGLPKEVLSFSYETWPR